jgi:hypothetical protein
MPILTIDLRMVNFYGSLKTIVVLPISGKNITLQF